MADNTGQQTEVISYRTTEVDGHHTNHQKVSFGADGEATSVDEDNPLPVTAAAADVDRTVQLKESIDEMVIQLKILNAYYAMGFDEAITEDEIR